MRKLLKNKNGFGYIMTCVSVLVAMMLLSVGIQYRQTLGRVKMQREEAQAKLDALVMRAAIDSYDALKQGAQYGAYIDYGTLTEEAYRVLGFPSAGTGQVAGEGYVMLRPEIQALGDGGFGVAAAYELRVPFEVFGRKVADIPVSVRLESRMTEK